MSLSRPIKFPLLKLPFLCIECVIKNCDVSDIIFFALISKRTRGIVRHVKPLTRIRIFVSGTNRIEFGRKTWNFRRTSSLSLIDKHQKELRIMPIVLQNNPIPLYTMETDYGFISYTDGNQCNALKMAMEFLNEIFNCSAERVEIQNDNFPESGNIGVKSAENLCIDYTFVYDQSQKLNLLLENLEVTDTCIFRMSGTENGFYCDPKLFKCKKLIFWSSSSTWVTREILLQFEVPRLNFCGCPISVEGIVSFVTKWFQSDNRKLEYLYIFARIEHIPLESFQTESLNPSSFNGRNRMPTSESFSRIDFSAGLELCRNDGLVATVHVNRGVFLFYVWHE